MGNHRLLFGEVGRLVFFFWSFEFWIHFWLVGEGSLFVLHYLLACGVIYFPKVAGTNCVWTGSRNPAIPPWSLRNQEWLLDGTVKHSQRLVETRGRGTSLLPSLQLPLPCGSIPRAILWTSNEALRLNQWVNHHTSTGGTTPETNEIVTNICSCHNFFSLSSVQIIFIPACCLLCVL